MDLSLCERFFLDRCLLFDQSKTAAYDVAGFVDFDYGGDLDHRRSTSSHIFTLCAGAISWKASLQPIVALPTTKAEYIVVTKGVKEGTWLKGLIVELGVPQGVTTMFSDSQSAIHLTKNDAYHSKTKHISIKYSEILLLQKRLL